MAKIENVLQQDLKDCGACSLLCIIKYYGGYVSLEKIREDTNTTNFGTTAFHLINAAKNYGFEAIGMKADSIDDENIYLPAIAHVVLKNGLNHFVVVYKITKKYIWIMDPARGKIKVSKKEFCEAWDNIILIFTPVTKIPFYENNINILTLLLELITKNKKQFFQICWMNIFITFITIFSSFYFQVALMKIQSSILKNIILFFLGLMILKVLFVHLKNYNLIYLNKNIDVTIFSEFLAHILSLPLNFIQNRSTGEIVSRINELNEIKNLIGEIFTTIILNSILIIGSSLVLFWISNKLFLMLLLMIIFLISYNLIINIFLKRKIKENIETSTDFNTGLIETIEMNTSIKNLGLTGNFLNRIENKLILMLKSNLKLNIMIENLECVKNVIYEIGTFLITSAGIYLVSINKLDLLSLITFNSVLLYLINPIKELLDLLPRIDYLKASFNKLKDFINIPREDLNTGLDQIENNSILIENLTFSYNHFNNILEDLNLKINSQEKVLLMGPSGTGKSTICKLISYQENNYRGIIRIGSTSEQDYSLNSIRNNITYVSQNEKIFSGTILENIICDRNIDEIEFLKVAKICELENIISKKKNRYQTYINASINNLSGGEKQRIILARALLKNCKILILDEALSEVNIEMEKTIIKNVKKYFSDKTLIYVSHKDVSSEFDKIFELGGENVSSI